MRRNKEKINIFFLISILLLLVVGISYAYLSTSLNIRGQVTGNFIEGGYVIDPGGNPDLNISNPSINSWKEGNVYKYQYRFNITNNGDKKIDNFTISLTFNHQITSVNIWNYDYEINNKILTIINDKHNLKSNQSLEISFIVGSSSNDLKLRKVKLETSDNLWEIDPSKFEVVFNKPNTWGNYVHQYSVSVTNKTGTLITYWQINLDLPNNTSYQSGWNALFQETENALIIKNESYNGRIENNKSVTFGLQLQSDVSDFVPTNYKIMVR